MRAWVHGATLAVAALALFLWAGIALVLYQLREDAMARANATGVHMARVLSEHEASSMRAIDLTLSFLRDQWLRSPHSMDEAVRRHEEHLKRERLVQVAVLGADGLTRYSRLPLAKPLDFSDRDYFRFHRASGRDELHISEPVMGRVTKQWAIQFTRPIRDAQGNFAGVIVVALPPPALEDIYRDLRIGPQDVITLVRSDGAILARTRDFDRASGVSLKGSPGLAAEDAPTGTLRSLSRIDSGDRLMAYSKVSSYPLTIYVGQSVDTVLAPYDTQRALLIGAGAIGTLLLILLGRVVISRRRLRLQVAEGEQRLAEQRERVMLELHDGAIQQIYAIGMHLERSRQQVDLDPLGAKRTIATAAAHLNLVIQELRNFIAGQGAAPRGQSTFIEEVERMVPDGADAEAPQFRLDIDEAVVKHLTPSQASHLLRITREGVSNVLRHAYAAKAQISLARAPEGAIRLEIADDGVGMREEAAQSRGLGLHHIGARGQKLAGRTRVESAPGRGTRIIVEFPEHA
jgi:signal transduction histidine kinase